MQAVRRWSEVEVVAEMQAALRVFPEYQRIPAFLGSDYKKLSM